MAVIPISSRTRIQPSSKPPAGRSAEILGTIGMGGKPLAIYIQKGGRKSRVDGPFSTPEEAIEAMKILEVAGLEKSSLSIGPA